MSVSRFVMLFATGLIAKRVLAIEVVAGDEEMLSASLSTLADITTPSDEQSILKSTEQTGSLITLREDLSLRNESQTDHTTEDYMTSSAGCTTGTLDPDKDEEACTSSSTSESPVSARSTSQPGRTSVVPRRLPPIDTGLISRSQYERVKFVTGCVMLVLPLIGMVLNSLNIAVFGSSQLKCPSSTILVCLSVAELFVITIQMIARSVDFAFGVESVYSYVYLTVTKYLAIYASAVFGRTTYYLILFVAAERLLAVAFPLRAKYFRLIQKPLIACGIILVVCASYHLYMPFMNTVVRVGPGQNVTRYKLNRTSFYVNNRALFTALHVMGEVVFVYIPLLSCFVLNAILIVIIHRHGRQQVVLSSTQDRRKISSAERQTTITILVSTSIFIFLVLPKPLGGLVAALRPDYGIYTKGHYLFLTVSKFAAVSNLLANCTNFIVYYTLGGIFRKTLHAKLCKRK